MTVRAVFRRTVGAQWPILLVGSIFAVGFVLAGANFWRRGALLIGIGVGVAAVLRLVLSEERAGLLVVRSKGWCCPRNGPACWWCAARGSIS